MNFQHMLYDDLPDAALTFKAARTGRNRVFQKNRFLDRLESKDRGSKPPFSDFMMRFLIKRSLDVAEMKREGLHAQMIYIIAYAQPE
jgi:hypothetical protein